MAAAACFGCCTVVQSLTCASLLACTLGAQMGDKTPDARVRTYADVMREAQLARERDNTLRNIDEKKRREAEEAQLAALDAVPTKASAGPAAAAAQAAAQAAAPGGKRSRWDSAAPVEA